MVLPRVEPIGTRGCPSKASPRNAAKAASQGKKGVEASRASSSKVRRSARSIRKGEQSLPQNLCSVASAAKNTNARRQKAPTARFFDVTLRGVDVVGEPRSENVRYRRAPPFFASESGDEGCSVAYEPGLDSTSRRNSSTQRSPARASHEHRRKAIRVRKKAAKAGFSSAARILVRAHEQSFVRREPDVWRKLWHSVFAFERRRPCRAPRGKGERGPRFRWGSCPSRSYGRNRTMICA